MSAQRHVDDLVDKSAEMLDSWQQQQQLLFHSDHKNGDDDANDDVHTLLANVHKRISLEMLGKQLEVTMLKTLRKIASKSKRYVLQIFNRVICCLNSIIYFKL